MKTIGWVIDDPGYIGGAELDALELLKAAPEWADIVICHAEAVEGDCDAYIVHNCNDFSEALIPLLGGKPVIKRVYDLWMDGNDKLRRWLLRNATLILPVSPLQHRAMRWEIQTPVEYIPCTVDVPKFRAADNAHRAGAAWIGRLYPGKGLDAAQQWAVEHETQIDVYGFGALEHNISDPLRYLGKLSPQDVPGALAQYETFVFLPDAVEPCGRSVVEAWAAGCKVATNGNCGAAWWIQNKPEALENSAAMFWAAVEKAVN